MKLPALAAQQRRPEEIIATFKDHVAIAPLVEGAELKEYSAHIIPEGGWRMVPRLAGNGLLVAGDAAALCLAAGVWLEGVNFALGSGLVAGEVAAGALASGDTSARFLAEYRRRPSRSFVLADHKRLRNIPHLVLSERVQHQYPDLMCSVVERMFRVDNPTPKPGLRRIVQDETRRAGVRLRDLARDGWIAARGFG